MAPRRAALAILDAVRGGAPFDAARDEAVAGLAERDRRLAHELAAGVLRQQRALDAQLDLRRADHRLHDVLRLGAYQLRYLDRVPPHAAVNTTVALARERAGDGPARYANRVLRGLTRSPLPAPGARTTHPDWLLERWRAHFGPDDATQLVAWNDARPALVLQPARWDLATLAARLAAAGIAAEPAAFGAGLRLVRRADRSPLPAPRSLPGYIEGGFVVQDPAHALVCRFAALEPGALVYDACAAPGGKAVTLEALGARVVAGDARRARIARLADTARRAGRGIRLVAADLLRAPFGDGTFDAVVVDAPCTATGTMARHPDARWRLSARAIDRLAERQRALLDAAASLVPPGGVLIYATCSLEPEENAAQVDALLERRSDFRRAPVAGAVAPELVTAAGDFTSLPHRHGMDGAFAARLVREPA